MSAFGDAFKAARAAGKKTFTFNGKSYHTRTKEDEAKTKPKSTPPMDEATKDRVKRNELEQKAIRGEDMSGYVKKMPDNRPGTLDEKGNLKRKSPEMKTMPDNRPGTLDEKGNLKRKSPEMMKADKKDDTSLSVSERIKNARERARTSDTGTDKRSVSERIKSAVKDAVSPTAGMARRARETIEKATDEGTAMKKGGSVRGYGMARGGKVCKML